MTESQLSLAADIGWLRLAAIWANEQSVEHMELHGGASVVAALEAARARFIDRLKEQERFKVRLLEQSGD